MNCDLSITTEEEVFWEAAVDNNDLANIDRQLGKACRLLMLKLLRSILITIYFIYDFIGSGSGRPAPEKEFKSYRKYAPISSASVRINKIFDSKIEVTLQLAGLDISQQMLVLIAMIAK